MIGLALDYFGNLVEVRIIGKEVLFRTSQFKSWADIRGIKLDKKGTLREFPELKDKEDWEKQAREKFKEKIKKMKSEEEICNYIKEDLTKFGYKPLYKQTKGFRPIKL